MLAFAIIVTIVIVLIVYKYVLKPPNFPPGPPRVPLLGSIPFLPGTFNRAFFFKMTKKYGPILSFYFGPEPRVLVSDAKLIKEIFKMQEVSGRMPNRPFDDARTSETGGRVRGILLSYGEIWSEQRRFALRSLRDMGLGKASMDEIINDEMIRLCNRFSKTINEPIRLDKKMNLSIVSALWTILTSETMDLEDPKSLKTIELIDKNIRNGSANPSLFSMLLPDVYKYSRNVEMFDKGLKSILDIFQPHIEEHAKTLDPNNPRDFLDMYLVEMARAQPGSGFHGAAGEKSLEVSLVDLFLAGTETTSTTLLWMFLYLLYHPEVEEKVHEEIDSVVGQTRIVKAEDKDLLPYTQAVILETLRFSSLVPYGLPHHTTSEVKFGGYTIPKDVAVIANIAYVHYDPDYWTKPDEFNPERFIDLNGKVIQNHTNFIPFSTGKRFCLGQSLAEKELFLFFTGIMQRFNLSNPEGHTLPDIKIEKDKGKGIIRAPPIYHLQMTKRSFDA